MTKNEVELSLLTQELYDMRADERDNQNQILQVLSVAATVLSIIFGGGLILGNGNENSTYNQSIMSKSPHDSIIYQFISSYLTSSRVIFLCNSIMFCTAITYVLKLSIGNMIRYYHTKDLQNRIIEIKEELFGSDEQGKEMLYWDEYRMSVMTLNPSHISSIYTLTHFVSYSMAILFALLFCLTITIIQYILIDRKQWYDYLGISIIVIIVIMCIVSFLYTSYNSKKISIWVRTNTLSRRQGERKKNSSTIHNILYFFYPRLSDLQKPLLIVLGAGSVVLLNINSLNYLLVKEVIIRLILFIIIFDYLAYQVRFQINDLRGWDEDIQSQKNKRLETDENNKRKYIWISLIVVLFRMALILVLLYIYRTILYPVMTIELTALFISTLIYELFRTYKCTSGIYLSVGVGYPLRVIVGASAVISVLPEPILFSNGATILLLISMYFWGMFASLLSWAQDVISIRKSYEHNQGFSSTVHFEKEHFQDIDKRLHSLSNSEQPLRKKGKWKELWNVIFLLSIVPLSIISFMETLSDFKFLFILMEIIILFLLVLACFHYEGEKIEKCLIITILMFIIKNILTLIFLHTNRLLIILIAVIQIMIVITFYELRYEPEHDLVKNIIITAAKCIISLMITKKISDELFKCKR